MFRVFRRWLFPLLLLMLFACEQPASQSDPLVLKVGGRQLTLQQFERELQRNYPDLQGLPYPEQLQLKIQQVHRLIERELIYIEAQRRDLRISPDELDAALVELRGNYSAEEYRQVLREAGQDEQSWKQALQQRLITEKLSAALLGPQDRVTDKDAEAYYLAHKDEFRRPAELRARQMLFESREEASAVLKLLKQGGDFATLAKQYSLSPDREDGGNLGYFSRGQLPPEFDQALFKLGAGQLSDPVESPYGFHLFLVERRRRAGLRPFAAVKREIIRKLSQQREEEAFQSWLERVHKETRIEVDWPLLKIEPQQP